MLPTKKTSNIVSIFRKRACIGLVLGLFAITVQAQVAPQRIAPSNNFGPIPGFVLNINSNPQPTGKFFFSPGLGKVLIRDQAAGNAFLVSSRQQTVSVYSAADFVDTEAGELELVSGSEPQQTLPLKVVDQRPAFTYGGQSYLVADKPALLGGRTSDEIKADDAYYALAAKKYNPTPQYLEDLKKYDTETEVLLFFGSWCQNCHKWLPNIFKVEEELKDSKISFRYHGLPKGAGDALAKKWNVSSVPTGILLQDGKEVGRISGPSWTFPDMNLRRHLVR